MISGILGIKKVTQPDDVKKRLSKYVLENSGCRSMMWRMVESEDSGAKEKIDYASICIELRKGIIPE